MLTSPCHAASARPNADSLAVRGRNVTATLRTPRRPHGVTTASILAGACDDFGHLCSQASRRDLEFEPIIPFDAGWADTLLWFKSNWLPTFNDKSGMAGLSAGTQKKIDIQAAGTGHSKTS